MIKFIEQFFWILWQLPQDLVAILMFPFLGKKKVVWQKDGVTAYEAKHMRGGISLGNIVYLSPSLANDMRYVRHELGHCKQSRILGWLYLIVIGLPSLLWATFKPDGICYYSFYTESWANKNAGLTVEKTKYGCRLMP